MTLNLPDYEPAFHEAIEQFWAIALSKWQDSVSEDCRMPERAGR